MPGAVAAFFCSHVLSPARGGRFQAGAEAPAQGPSQIGAPSGAAQSIEHMRLVPWLHFFAATSSAPPGAADSRPGRKSRQKAPFQIGAPSGAAQSIEHMRLVPWLHFFCSHVFSPARGGEIPGRGGSPGSAGAPKNRAPSGAAQFNRTHGPCHNRCHGLGAVAAFFCSHVFSPARGGRFQAGAEVPAKGAISNWSPVRGGTINRTHAPGAVAAFFCSHVFSPARGGRFQAGAEAPAQGPSQIGAPSGAAQLIENMCQFVIDAMRIQQPQQFFLKRPLGVMNRLPIDIFHNLRR